jgi:alpha-tubulin suppressor-like RCC1 family protein
VPAGGTIVVDRAQIVKARAWVSGATPSAVRRADFLVSGTLGTGAQHTVALSSDGSVWAWGRGTEGQLGIPGSPTSSEPVSVLTDAVSVAGGDKHTLAARADGTAWAWGWNASGRLGDGTTTNRPTPVQITSLADVAAVAAGYDHSLALKRDGTVWAFGGNTTGQLGLGATSVTQATPVQVVGLVGITQIAAGHGFSLALQSDGAGGGFVWAWGDNADGQLGDGSRLMRTRPVRLATITTAVEIAAGQAFGAVRLADGTVRAWGLNSHGQLGSLTGGSAAAPITMPALQQTTSLMASTRHGIATDDDGRAWGWGHPANGQLGIASRYDALSVGAPLLLGTPTGIIDATGTVWQSFLLRADGSLWHTQYIASITQDASVIAMSGLSLAPNAWLLTDGDGDGLPAWREYLAGTDPLAKDTNGNGLSDLIDVQRRSQSGNADDDGDGVPNAVERTNGTDPFTADTDGDGASDRLDDYPLDPTRSVKPPSDPNDTTPPTIILTLPTNARPVGGGQ